MATTSNLKLNLFNGNDRPNHELFNKNNEIIDNILITAKTHNHDGLNSEKIKATNVVFNNNDTTLKANNLEDAVKEVFQEADSKIQWITDTIGKTSSGVSNPDIKVEELKADFETARDTYLENMKKATLFKVQGTLPSSTASMRDITDAINNTNFKEATATCDDIVVGARAIDKFGVPVDGTLAKITQEIIKPSATENVVFKKGVYDTFSFLGFGVSNPEMYIRRGKNILGIDGVLTEHGSNGWDVGDNILKTKVDSLHNDSCFIKELLHSNYSNNNKYATFCSSKYPINLSVGGKSILAQHFKINNRGELIAYTSDFRDHVIKYLDSFNPVMYGNISRNPYTNQFNMQIIQYPNASYLITLNGEYVVIVNLNTFKTVYSRKPHYGTAYGMVVKKDPKDNMPKVVVYGKYNYNYYSVVLKNLDPSNIDSTWGSTYYTLGPDIHYVSNNVTRESIEVIPKYSVSTGANSIYSTNCRLEGERLFLNMGDKLKVNRYLKNYDGFELVYSIPVGGVSSTLKIIYEDDNGGTSYENISISSSATTSKICNPAHRGTVHIECTKGIVKIHAIKVPKVGVQGNVDMLFSKEWGFLGHNLVPMHQVTIDEIEDECLLWAGSITDFDNGESTAMIALSRMDLNEDLFNKIPKAFSYLEVSDMYLGTYQDVDLNHKALSFMSEYDNYLYGTFPNKEISSVAVTGTRYYKFNRRLVRLGFTTNNDSKVIDISLRESTKALEYRLFKPMVINHLGEVIGLEQGCTPQKFTYLTKLNSNLVGGYIDNNWSEDYFRTAEEEFKILDDGNSINTLRMLTGVTRCFNEDGTLSNTKLLGNVYNSTSTNYRNTTADMGAAIDTSKKFFNGFVSMFNTIYQINSVKE